MEQLRTIGRDLAMGGAAAMVGSGGGVLGASSKDFLDLVKAIGEAKSKAEEDRIITHEIETLKARISLPDIPHKKMKEYVIRLLYVEMLGHDASFGYIQALKMTHHDNLLLKRTGYLAVTLFLNDQHDLIILIVNTIQKDLKSDNYLICCAALSAASKLLNEETIPAVLTQVIELLGHPKEMVRKKAVMALHSFYQRSPSSISHLIPKFAKSLSDNDPSVMSASLCALFDVILVDAQSYRNLTGSFVSILKQVIEHRLPKHYDYHQSPAPFIQVKLLKILALLGAGDKRTSESMYGVLSDVLKRADATGNISNAILYECICTITSIHANKRLLESAAEITSRFLKNENHNLRYMGIDALGRIIKINPEFAEEHQIAVIDCLEDPDDTLKRKTLDLLYKMTKSSNVEVIVERMITYTKTINDSHYKTEIASRSIELAERFAPSNQWFIQTMNRVFEHAGDLVPPKVAHDLMRLIAEGSGEDNEDSDSQLRSSAVDSYLQILGEPKLPSILLQVICWVLGEYGTADGIHSAGKIIAKMCDVVEAHSNNDVVKGYVITAITKLCAFEIAAGRRLELIPECQVFIEELLASHSTDLQQRAYELQAILGLDAEFIGELMPRDASCEDIEVDKNLSFLDSFVQSALVGGAKPYMLESEGSRMGVPLSSYLHKQGDAGPALRFDPYEKPMLPVVVESSTSSVKELLPSGVRASYATHPAQSWEPHQLNSDTDDGCLRLDGVQKKWGPINYASPASKERPTNGPSTSSSGKPLSESQSKDNSSAATTSLYEESWRGEKGKSQSNVSAEKRKLAASLFGGGPPKPDNDMGVGKGSKSSSTAKKGHVLNSTEKKAGISKPSPNPVVLSPPPDLLDLSGEDQVSTIVEAKDPFKQLEGVLEQPMNQAIPKPEMMTGLVSLYDADVLSSHNVVPPIPSSSFLDQISKSAIANIGSESIIGLSLDTSDGANNAVALAKKGPSADGALQRDALARQVGVTPTNINRDLFRDLFNP